MRSWHEHSRGAVALLALVSALVVASPAAAAPDRGFGLSVQANIAAMTVDLNPSYAGVPGEGGTGHLSDSAVTRYRQGRVKPLLPLSAQSQLGNVATAQQQQGQQANAGPR